MTISLVKRLDRLPDDVLLLIIEDLTIDDFFSLRQASRTICILVSAFEHVATSVVAKRTFPGARLLLRPPPDGKCTIQWLKDRIPRYLAAVVVDRYRFSFRGSTGQCDPGCTVGGWGMPAEDPLSGPFRCRICRGWRILKTLSNISREVCAILEAEMPQLSWLSRLREAWSDPQPDLGAELNLLRLREQLVLKRRRAYLRTLTRSDAIDFLSMEMLLCAAFKTKHDCEPLAGLQSFYMSINGDLEPPSDNCFDWGGDTRRSHSGGNSWVNWYIFHEGPTLFWKQWCPNDTACSPRTGPLIHDELLAAWEAENDKSADIKRQGEWRLRRMIRSRQTSWRDHPYIEYSAYDPISYFREYEREKARQQQGRAHAVEETMTNVEYFIDSTH